jgi:hypothetical protein
MRWLGKRFHIIANCILIVRTPSLSYRLQLILQVDYMMILVVYYSCTLTVKLRLCPTEESGQFRFLRAAYYANIKGSVGLILAKASPMRISIPLDLSSRPFILLPRFICRRRPLPLLGPFLVFAPRRSA